jgi:DNA-binding MarR family transcriptional regulator
MIATPPPAQGPAPSAAEQLDTATLLSLAGGLADRAVLEAMRARGHDVTRAHGFIFQRLLTGHQTVTALAAGLRMTQQGASKHVQELERLGLVTRHVAPHDRRARIVALTDEGLAAIRVAREARAEFEERLRDVVGDVALGETRRALARLLDVFGVSQHLSERAIPWQE